MCFIVCTGGAVTVLLSGSFPTLEPTDFLQDREAAGGPVADFTKATVSLAALADDAVRCGASLHLCKSNLQTGQRVFPVLVLLSLVPLLVLHSC